MRLSLIFSFERITFEQWNATSYVTQQAAATRR